MAALGADITAAQKSHDASIRGLVGLGADVNMTNASGVTPLCIAVRHDDEATRC